MTFYKGLFLAFSICSYQTNCNLNIHLKHHVKMRSKWMIVFAPVLSSGIKYSLVWITVYSWGIIYSFHTSSVFQIVAETNFSNIGISDFPNLAPSWLNWSNESHQDYSTAKKDWIGSIYDRVGLRDRYCKLLELKKVKTNLPKTFCKVLLFIYYLPL